MKSYVFPGDIEEDILRISGQPFPYMRTRLFSELVKDSEQMLLSLIGCPNGRVIPYTASGTAAMEAVVANFVSTKQKAFVIAGGSFGMRWKNLCDYYQCPADVFHVDFAKDIDYNALEEAIRVSQPEVLLCQHHETSTGILYNLSNISAICKKYEVFLIVDVISSFLTDPLNMDELGIDVCITSSQKGLNIVPGLSFVILSERMLHQEFVHKGFYLDFNENLTNLKRGQTPYSPATSLFMQLHARLNMYVQIGMEQLIESRKQKAQHFRSLCAQNGWEMPVEVPSNCITGFFVHHNGDHLFEELLKQDIYIMPGGTPHYFRVSHIGLQSVEELNDLARRIKVIEQMNF